MTYTVKTATYFQSEEWLAKRLARLRIDNFTCRLCGAKHVRLEVHHKPGSYALIPRESVEDDLTTLCADCHKAFHESWTRRKRAWAKSNKKRVKRW